MRWLLPFFALFVLGACSSFGDTKCETSQDCPTDNNCVNQVCIAAKSCSGDIDCPLNQVCNFGRCKLGCNVHSDCPLGTWCTNKQCQAPEKRTCQNSSDCPPDSDCDPQASTCSKKRDAAKRDSCTANATCRQGETCHPDKKACVKTAPGPSCEKETDCTDPSMYCHPTTKFCERKAVETCSSTADCLAGKTCHSSIKRCLTTCQSDSECLSTERCNISIGGHCILKCRVHHDCPGSDICNLAEGICLSRN